MGWEGGHACRRSVLSTKALEVSPSRLRANAISEEPWDWFSPTECGPVEARTRFRGSIGLLCQLAPL